MSDHSKSSPLKMYFSVWAALLLGTFITYKAAFIELGRFNAAVALTIATVKALLVALFFMHLKGASEKLLKLVVISTVFFLFILLALSMADYGTRAWSRRMAPVGQPPSAVRGCSPELLGDDHSVASQSAVYSRVELPITLPRGEVWHSAIPAARL